MLVCSDTMRAVPDVFLAVSRRRRASGQNRLQFVLNELSARPVLSKRQHEGVAVDLEPGHQRVLVAAHRIEGCFREGEDVNVRLGTGADGNHAEPRLIAVHGTQNHSGVWILRAVRQLHLVEGHRPVHPALTRSRRVRVDTH